MTSGGYGGWERVACGRTASQAELVRQARELIGSTQRHPQPRSLKLWRRESPGIMHRSMSLWHHSTNEWYCMLWSQLTVAFLSSWLRVLFWCLPRVVSFEYTGWHKSQTIGQ